MTDANDAIDKELAKLAQRSDALAEGGTLPRGALPGLFRAAREAGHAARAVSALAPRLPDLPLVQPTLELVAEQGLAAEFVEAALQLGGRGAWCSLRQTAALAEGAPTPGWVVDALGLLLQEEPSDPTELALARDPGPFAERLRELIRLRLSCAASKRCRTSSAIARGALRALARVAADTEEALLAARQILLAEARRAEKGEPLLALAALDALDASPPLARVRLLYPLVDQLARRKVQTRAREVLARAVEEVGCAPEELVDLCAREGGAEPDGWVRIPLEEGGETRVRIDARGDVELDGPVPCVADKRAVENAERILRADWDELARRLERALVAGRDWTAGLWREVFAARHPLWLDLAARVVWERREAETRTPFVWEEGEARDLFGDPLPVEEPARVGLWHPALADADERELWRERALTRAAAGELRAPFPQAFREVGPPSEDPLGPFRGREAHADAVEEMARRGGWSGCPLLGSPPWELEREAQGLFVRVVLEEVKIAFKATLQQRRSAHRKARDGEKPVVKQQREARPRVRLSELELEGELGAPDVRRALAEAVADLERLTDPLATVDDLFLRTWQQRKWQDPKEAWKEVVLRYREGSPAALESRRALIAAFIAAEGLDVRLEDRFAIVGPHVVELGTGLCHEGPPKDHLPLWKADELAAAANDAAAALPFPFRREAAPEAVAVVERVIGLARAARERAE